MKTLTGLTGTIAAGRQRIQQIGGSEMNGLAQVVVYMWFLPMVLLLSCHCASVPSGGRFLFLSNWSGVKLRRREKLRWFVVKRASRPDFSHLNHAYQLRIRRILGFIHCRDGFDGHRIGNHILQCITEWREHRCQHKPWFHAQ